MSVRIPYAYTDASTFSPTDHNTNIYDDTTVSGEENGILSALNGGVVAADFDSAFQITRETIQPGEGILVEGSYVTDTNDFFDDVFGDFESASFLKVPGRVLRIDLPWPGNVLWNIQCFISADHFTQDVNGTIKTPDLLLRPTLDGSAVTALTRGVPITTALDDSNNDGAYLNFFGRTGIGELAIEARRASRYSISWLSTGLAAGVHEIALTLYIERLAVSDKTISVVFGNDSATGSATIDASIEAHCRVTFGISHVTALPMFVG